LELESLYLKLTRNLLYPRREFPENVGPQAKTIPIDLRKVGHPDIEKTTVYGRGTPFWDGVLKEDYLVH